MYAYIKGKIEDMTADRVVIEANNIGYNVYVPSGVMSAIGCTGKEVKLYTYLNVKEDAFTLFGFLTKEDLELFKLLITVSGIGPKGAMGLLGALPSSDLRFAIMSGDSKTISSAPGIGAKTAQKVIIELKDKLKAADFMGTVSIEDTGSDVSSNSAIVNEAVLALTSLGYGQTEALRAIRQCTPENIETVEQLIKEALKKMI